MRSRYAELADIEQLVPAVREYAEMLNGRSQMIDPDYVIYGLLPALIAELKVIVLETGDREIVATAAGLPSASPFNPNLMLFVELFWWVREDQRSKGVGDLLLEKYEGLAREFGVDVCTMNLLGNSPHLEKLGQHLEKGGYSRQEMIYAKPLGEM